jgi:hypothetical protein
MSAEERYRKLVVLYEELRTLDMDGGHEMTSAQVRGGEILLEVIKLLGLGTFSSRVSSLVQDIIRAYEWDTTSKKQLKAHKDG